MGTMFDTLCCGLVGIASLYSFCFSHLLSGVIEILAHYVDEILL